MKKILLLGSNGMLGQEFFRQLKNEYEVITVARNNADFCFDLTNDDELKKCFAQTRPHIVINAAACVNLGQCEEDKAMAYQINGRLPGIVAELCRDDRAYFVQISTDHFYRDDGDKKHDETEPIVLLNEYARSKYIGECLALLNSQTLVVRTNIVGFRHSERPTFLEWVLDGMHNKEKFSLFTDFYTSSMFTEDFVKVCKDLILKEATGIYNVASSEVSSKKDFILCLADKMGEDIFYEESSVKAMAGAKRGDSLGLNTKKVETLLGYSMPTLEETINHILAKK